MRAITSASNLHRRVLCPGSAALELRAPKEIASDDSKEGTLLHSYMSETSGVTLLTDDQFYAVQFCESETLKLANGVFKDANIEVKREVTLMLDGKEFGHADFIAMSGKTAIVIDYKFGRNLVDSAECNYQLRAYAVMVSEQYDIDLVYAVIIQPRVESDCRVTAAAYDRSDLIKAKAEIIQILNNNDSTLNPTEEGCRYCKAKAICPSLMNQTNEIEKVVITQITKENAADLFLKAKLVRKHLDAIEDHVYDCVKAIESSGDKAPGITMKPGAQRRIISDTTKAYESLSEIIDPKTFASCCTVKLGELEAAYKSSTGKTTKDSKAALDELLRSANCLELKSSEPSLILINS